tara:strand:+ start:222 stop:1325 length:1104 start_codon:yes stop_codon:yes gene_type:complete
LKILILSDANSIHTIKWVESIKDHGIDIQLFSLFKPSKITQRKYDKNKIKVVSADLISEIKDLRNPNLSKFKYLKSFSLIKNMIKNFNPDIVHAHYASSYGILGYLTRFKPFVISVWGSDVSYFPYKNKINKILMKIVFRNCDRLCSTSRYMKTIIENEYKRYDVEVIPFGVNPDIFKPNESSNENYKFNVGTIKSIESHNGIDCLLDAAKIIIHDFKKEINFIIVGDGSLKYKMQQKAKKLNLCKNVGFTGFVDHKNVIKFYNRLSIFVAVSERESFGVSVLEAASCEIPSITTNVGGLTEVNVHNSTGIVINEKDPIELAKSILLIYENDKLRKNLGRSGRKRVLKYFTWKNNVSKMVNIYKSLV